MGLERDIPYRFLRLERWNCWLWLHLVVFHCRWWLLVQWCSTAHAYHAAVQLIFGEQPSHLLLAVLSSASSASALIIWRGCIVKERVRRRPVLLVFPRPVQVADLFLVPIVTSPSRCWLSGAASSIVLRVENVLNPSCSVCLPLILRLHSHQRRQTTLFPVFIVVDTP